MSVTVSRRAADLVTKKQLVTQQGFIEESTNELRKVSEKRKKLVLARLVFVYLNAIQFNYFLVSNHRLTLHCLFSEYYAASRINGIVRGYLDRILCKGLMRIFRATMLIQRLIRGKLGRMKWMREYWRMRSVVRSDTALVVRNKTMNSIKFLVCPYITF